MVDGVFPPEIRDKFEIHSYRGAATILARNFPEHFNQVVSVLTNFEINTKMIRLPGGGKGPIAKHVERLFDGSGWKETRITADLHVKLLPAKGQEILRQYIREGYLDGHRIDFVRGKVAFDFEWNSKDQTYDRDLYAFCLF